MLCMYDLLTGSTDCDLMAAPCIISFLCLFFFFFVAGQAYTFKMAFSNNTSLDGSGTNSLTNIIQ